MCYGINETCDFFHSLTGNERCYQGDRLMLLELIFLCPISLASRRDYGKMILVPGWCGAGPDVLRSADGGRHF